MFDVSIGFLIGTATGAAGTYYSEVFTEKRLEKKRAKDEKRVWADVQRRFPAIIAEMKEDVGRPENANVRDFYLKSSGSTVSSTTPAFEYHTDKHADLLQAIAHLEELGYIENVTMANVPMYRMLLPFAGLLRKAT